ncbi:hypothetical protein [Ferrimonas sediminicola]|uniref:hypothetical protein n=1 Tax=Ferrimonas sediminicola TaxID=2569538 RepID=UPI00197ABA97|nr:hypothetical protein [Ferrimonas sediminicola]
MVQLHEGKDALAKLIAETSANHDMNEAQTRFHIIDHILKQCLGWEGELEVEVHERENGFSDYELVNLEKR